MYRIVKLPYDVPGHLYLSSMPGRYERYEAAKSKLINEQIRCVICLAPLDEIREKSPDYAEAIEEGELPWKLERFPVCDYQGPDDDHGFWELAKQVAGFLRAEERILVHCGAGIGRTGTFAISVLMALGMRLDEARQTVKEAGSGPERPAQEEALRRITRRAFPDRGV